MYTHLNTHFLRPLLFAVLWLALLTLNVNAQTDTANPDAAQLLRNQNIAAVVGDQIDAFSKDDGDRAFSHASPTIQAHFKTPAIFMRMVQSGYGMVYRPKTFEIESVQEENGIIYQPVLFTDQQNQLYKVLYLMEQQEDDSWKINGVQVLRPKGVAV